MIKKFILSIAEINACPLYEKNLFLIFVLAVFWFIVVGSMVDIIMLISGRHSPISGMDFSGSQFSSFLFYLALLCLLPCHFDTEVLEFISLKFLF